MARSALVALAAPIVLAPWAGAQPEVVYEQLPATSEGDVSGGYYSNALSNTLLYDAFALDSTTLLDEVQLWGFGFMYDPVVELTLYEAVESVQVGPVLASRSYTPAQIDVVVTSGWVEEGHFWWSEERASFAIDPPIRLERGREYWIGVAGEDEVVWSYKALSGDLNILYSNAGQDVFWDQNDTDMAFRLLGREASPADLGEPYGSLDFNDVVAFLAAYGAGEAGADLAQPFGSHDFADVIAFLTAFAAGLP